MLYGSFPLGFTAPNSTSATALRPNGPPYGATTMAAASCTTGGSAYGRP